MKTLCTSIAIALATAFASSAAVPISWTATPASPPYAPPPVPHGSAVEFAVTLKGFTTPPIAPGADVRLWYQTNGMGSAWFSAPASLSSNVVTASWGPEQDCGADRYALFFGAPSNVFASAVLRLTHAPGFAPARLPLPVQYLDFSTVELRNVHALTNGWSFGSTPGDYEAVSNKTTAIGGEDGNWLFYGTAQRATHAQQLSDDASLHMLYFDDEEGRWLSNEYYGLTRRSLAYLSDIPDPPDLTPYATKTELGSVSETANAAALDAASALRIVLGESVWFVVTNHMRTAEGVIPSLQLWEVRDSVTNLVYDSREEITNTVKALTRVLHTELTNRIHDVEETIPSKAWGNYQSDGTDNPEPGKVAIVNQPTVILTGGGTFNKYVEIGDSSIWVLTSSGPVSFGGGGTNGNYFAVLDDEGNAHFKVSKTDSFDVEAIFTDNPRTSGDALLLYVCSTNRQGEAYIGPPTLSACTNLQEAVWHDEVDGEIDALGTSVAWVRNDAIHAWVGTVTQDRWATAMFFRAKMKQEGGTAIINTAPVRFDGGIQLGNGTYRLVPYTTGGKTYLTVEGLQ